MAYRSGPVNPQESGTVILRCCRLLCKAFLHLTRHHYDSRSDRFVQGSINDTPAFRYLLVVISCYRCLI